MEKKLRIIQICPFPLQIKIQFFSHQTCNPRIKDIGQKAVADWECAMLYLQSGDASYTRGHVLGFIGSSCLEKFESCSCIPCFHTLTCEITLMRVQPITLLGKPTPSSTCKHLLLVINMFAFRKVLHTKKKKRKRTLLGIEYLYSFVLRWRNSDHSKICLYFLCIYFIFINCALIT